jgi:hypothetical protein
MATQQIARREPQEDVPRGLAILNNFDRTKFNVLAPVSMESLSPFHTVRFATETISPNPDDGEVFKVGSRKVGEQWENLFALGKVALLKLGDVAGVRWDVGQCRRMDDMRSPMYVSWQVVGRVQRPDGTWHAVKATKELDLEVILAEIRAAHAKKAPGTKDYPKSGTPEQQAAYVEAQAQAEFLQFRKHKVARCETGAYNRALRALLKLKNTYTTAELRKPFAVAQIALDPSKDPRIANAMRVQSIHAMYDLGYEDNDVPREQLEQANEMLALAEGRHDEPDDGDDPSESAEQVDEADELGDDNDEEFDAADVVDASDAPSAPIGDESKRQELIDALKELAPRKWKSGVEGLRKWWGSYYPDTLETADLETLQLAYQQLAANGKR